MKLCFFLFEFDGFAGMTAMLGNGLVQAMFAVGILITPAFFRVTRAAALSIANCQIELKDTRTARKTLEDLVRAYPQSEAAVAAKERLSRLK